MHEIKKYIRKIVDDGSIEEMYKLSDILDEVTCIIKSYDENLYNMYKMKMYSMAYGDNLNWELANEIVSKMQPYGERFSLEESRDIQDRFGMNNINDIDFYVVANSAFNDYKDLFGDNIEMYAIFTKNFIEDEDAKPGKVFRYFTTIVK